MKTKIILIFSLLFYSFLSHAQLSAVDYTSKGYAQFKGSKTYVLLTGDAKYDAEIKSAVNDLWKVTPFDFIGGKDFESKISDKSASFLVLVDIPLGSYGQEYNLLALINGGKKKITSYGYADMIAYAPINHHHNESRDVDCWYRVRNMLESMLLSMDIVQKNDIKGNSKDIGEALEEFYNKRAKNIPNRTLLICEKSLGEKITKADISGVYPYKFEMCNEEKIQQVIKEKNKEYYYLQPAITMNKFMYIFDPSNGEVVYSGFKASGSLDVKAKEIESLVKTIKGK